MFRRRYHKAQSQERIIRYIPKENYHQSSSAADSHGIVYPSRAEQIRAYILVMDTIDLLDKREREKLQIKQKIDNFLSTHNEMLFDNCS